MFLGHLSVILLPALVKTSSDEQLLTEDATPVLWTCPTGNTCLSSQLLGTHAPRMGDRWRTANDCVFIKFVFIKFVDVQYAYVVKLTP